MKTFDILIVDTWMVFNKKRYESNTGYNIANISGSKSKDMSYN